jgi:hypothetical protein
MTRSGRPCRRGSHLRALKRFLDIGGTPGHPFRYPLSVHGGGPMSFEPTTALSSAEIDAALGDALVGQIG